MGRLLSAVADTSNKRDRVSLEYPAVRRPCRIYEQELKQIHDDLDAAVAEAYGWPAELGDEGILRRLVALNAERAEEESRGIVRWLRIPCGRKLETRSTNDESSSNDRNTNHETKTLAVSGFELRSA